MRRGTLRLAGAASSMGWGWTALVAPLWAVNRRFRVLSRQLAELPPPPADPLPWDELRGDDLRELLAVNPVLDQEEVDRRVASGMTCFACRLEGRIIHYRWYASAPVWLPFLDLTWEPERGDYTSLDIYTAPGLRGRGIHTRLAIQGLLRARDLGFTRLVGFVAWWNRPSLAVGRRFGFDDHGVVTRWGFRPMTFHTASGKVLLRDGVVRVPPIGGEGAGLIQPGPPKGTL